MPGLDFQRVRDGLTEKLLNRDFWLSLSSARYYYFSFRRLHTLIGHRGEISNAQFNFDNSLIVTGSMVICILTSSNTLFSPLVVIIYMLLKFLFFQFGFFHIPLNVLQWSLFYNRTRHANFGTQGQGNV